LFRDKDKLGEVQILYKKKEIQHYQDYDEFWDDITAE